MGCSLVFRVDQICLAQSGRHSSTMIDDSTAAMIASAEREKASNGAECSETNSQ